VVDVTGDVPRVLRPGLVTVPMLEAVVGPVQASGGCEPPGVSRSPGQMEKHYAPKTPLVLAADEFDAEQMQLEDIKFGVRSIALAYDLVTDYRFISDDPAEYAAEMYALLHELDDGSYDRIVVVLPPDTPEWAGVRDRLMRAAAK